MSRTTDEVMRELNEVFRKVFASPSLVVHETTTASDVPDWDSLSHTTLISAVETHFGVKFTLKEVMRLQNVGDLCATVLKKLA